ncbi:hypothetical protein OJAV_G00235800 [Oryzias javanicus]|uniref:Uncharacterized protein n=1 Tax=Oryzias javanicus TaxID=123683 RepID=A0A3S2MBJ1_ORYJA|nr:hypothetical protein OJAV_G00235800 [Oryzias javanicus]
MQSCSVLDLNAFERQNKAEGLGMVTEEGSGKTSVEEREDARSPACGPGHVGTAAEREDWGEPETRHNLTFGRRRARPTVIAGPNRGGG